MGNNERVAQLASWLWWVVSVLLYVLPAAYLAFLILAVRAPDWPRALFPHPAIPERPDWPTTAVVLALALAAAVPVVQILLHMRGLFGNYRRGCILTERSARHIFAIGSAMVSLGVLKMVVPPMQLLLLTKGQALTLNFNDGLLILLLVGGFLATVGWAMREAVDVVEENRRFI